jgi:alpha-glucosidase (family GH31 glycosyl hydrolase)
MDHSAHTLETKSMLDESTRMDQERLGHTLQVQLDHALAAKHSLEIEKSNVAHRSIENLSQVQNKKKVYEAIEATERSLKAHDHQLRHDMVNKKQEMGTEMNDHSDHVHQVKQELEALHDSIVQTQTAVDAKKHIHATEIRRNSLSKIQNQAHKSVEHVNIVQTRKELHDVLLESEKHRKQHDLELKQEFVAAVRHDYLEGVKEKQAHLQGNE